MYQCAIVNKMAAASLRFRSVCEEDLDNLPVGAIPETTKL